MKSKMTLFGFVAPCLLAGTLQAQDFEGVYRQRMVEVGSDAVYELLGEDMYGEPSAIADGLADLSIDAVLAADDVDIETLVLHKKGSFTRAQPDVDGAPPGYQIVNVATGTSWMVSVPEKTYLEFTQQAAEDMAAQAEKMMENMGVDREQLEEYEAAMEAEADAEAGESEAMGRSADVNGFQSKAYRYTSDREVVVGWCAEDKSGFFAAMLNLAASSPMGEEGGSSKDWICPDNLMPVRTIIYDNYSGDLEVDEILSISREAVSDDLFKVPAGFKKQEFSLQGVIGQ